MEYAQLEQRGVERNGTRSLGVGEAIKYSTVTAIGRFEKCIRGHYVLCGSREVIVSTRIHKDNFIGSLNDFGFANGDKIPRG